MILMQHLLRVRCGRRHLAGEALVGGAEHNREAAPARMWCQHRLRRCPQHCQGSITCIAYLFYYQYMFFTNLRSANLFVIYNLPYKFTLQLLPLPFATHTICYHYLNQGGGREHCCNMGSRLCGSGGCGGSEGGRRTQGIGHRHAFSIPSQIMHLY